MRVAIVAAVSTPGQATDEKYSIPQQLTTCREACQARGWTVVAEVSIPGHSRNYNWLDELVGDCPEYGQLMHLIRSGSIDLVVARDYDRLWRTDALRAQVAAVCREHQVQVFSLNQPVEPVSPELLDTHDTAQLSEVLFGYIAEQENRARVRRCAVGMEGRFRRGLQCARGRMPHGYKRGVDRQSPMVIDESKAVWVRWLFEKCLAGLSMWRMSRELNALGVPSPLGRQWTDTAVADILRNPSYMGAVRWKGQVNLNGQHEAIVTPDVWQRAQEMIRDLPHRRSAWHSPLSGLMRCGRCGGAMVCVCQRGYWYMRCGWYLHSGGKECHANSHIERKVSEAVLAKVKVVLADPELHLQNAHQDNGREGEIASLETAIAALQGRWERWSSLFEAGGIGAEELLQHRQRILGQAESLRSRVATLRAEGQAEELRRESVLELAAIAGELDHLAPAELREAYHTLIRHVVLERGKPIKIEWW